MAKYHHVRSLAEDHQENLVHYIEEDGYDEVLAALEKVLDYFEDELGQEGRVGRWLGGSRVSVADITLGLYLHRLYQLGLDTRYYQGGVRPNLSIFYQSIRARQSFESKLKWRQY